MTKTFEQLQHEADMQEFASEVGLEEIHEGAEDTTKVVVHAPMKMVVRKVGLLAGGMRETAKELNANEYEAKLSAKGDFEEVQTQEEHREEALQDWENEIDQMWAGITSKFGNALNFPGSPFEKVNKANKLSEIIECLELAQEYLDAIMEDDSQVIHEEQIEQVGIEQ